MNQHICLDIKGDKENINDRATEERQLPPLKLFQGIR